MRYARLGPSSVLVRVLITEVGLPREVLHHLLGFKAGQHILAATAASSSSSSKQAGDPKVLATAPRLTPASK